MLSHVHRQKDVEYRGLKTETNSVLAASADWFVSKFT